ncbi:hypothetical protein CXG81DRAFT_24116 [Caulochytrium protostelioides]|uniref:Uncharacterized protein n=1 Tax=Caulochytrium protostelioides TaxID=1555241 RepID=A0A4P9XDH8_9FUNG|nr:hypothetical protein CXG81DRAFT_24116 [Caulochytrium protostelioides]|eukprot:RKP03230.1 hypothetical protein CXG81DRAFT_24116 [Caulochytrium protostelioides]
MAAPTADRRPPRQAALMAPSRPERSVGAAERRALLPTVPRAVVAKGSSKAAMVLVRVGPPNDRHDRRDRHDRHDRYDRHDRITHVGHAAWSTGSSRGLAGSPVILRRHPTPPARLIASATATSAVIDRDRAIV